MSFHRIGVAFIGESVTRNTDSLPVAMITEMDFLEIE